MKKRLLVVPIILTCFLMSCATIGIGIKPWSQKTPTEKALTFLDAYISQFSDTLSMATTPNITDAQRVIVRSKKAVLKEAWPLIGIYVSTVEKGGIPPIDTEQRILDLLNRIGARIGG